MFCPNHTRSRPELTFLEIRIGVDDVQGPRVELLEADITSHADLEILEDDPDQPADFRRVECLDHLRDHRQPFSRGL